jgi:hypothetical protein
MRTMRDRFRGRLARTTFALELLLVVGSPLAWILWVPDGYSVDLGGIVILPFMAVGMLILNKQPRNAIGWVLLAIGLIWGLADAAFTYSVFSWARDGARLPGAGVAMAVSSASWVPQIGLSGTFLLLLFPDGKPPSPRWKPWAWLSGVALVAPMIVLTFMPGPLDNPPLEDVHNPLGIESLGGLLDALAASIVLVPLSILGCAVAMIQRFRRSRGVERLQMKWLAGAAAVCAAIYLVAMALSLNHPWSTEETPFWIGVIQDTAFVSFSLIPVAMGFAVLRYRLYEIDVIINRTLVYGALSAVLAGVYAICVVVIPQALGVGGDSELVVAGSTLAVAALFQPLRRRIQGFIDRRFYRRKYDAAKAVEAFAKRLRNEVDLEAMRADLTAAVQETMQPRRVSLWLRG